MVSQRLSLSLPTGPLGLGIQKHEVTGLCFVTSVGNVDVPLQLKDVILSLNGIVLADVDGGVDAVVKLFVAFASGPRTVVVKRGVPRRLLLRSASSLTAETIARMEKELSVRFWANVLGAYKAGILAAVSELKDRTGSSYIAIRKHMQARMPENKKWQNATYLRELKKLTAEGDLVQTKGRYKLSAEYKEKVKESKKIGKAKKANDAIASLNKAVRASLSPVPAMNGPVDTPAPYPATTTAAVPPRVARVSLSPVPNNASAPAPVATQREQQARVEKYKAWIVAAINGREKRAGSAPTLKKIVQTAVEAQGGQFHDATFNWVLRKMVTNGQLVQDKSTYAVSTGQRTGTETARNTGLQHAAGSGGTNGTSSVAAPGVSMWKCDFACGAIFPTFELAGAHELVCEKNPEGNNGASKTRSERVVVSVVKPSKESSLGIGIVQDGSGSVNVSSIASNGLLVGTKLMVGMQILAINCHPCTTPAEAVTLFKAAVGLVTIVAAAPKPPQPVEVQHMDWRVEASRFGRAQNAAGYTLPQT